MEQGRHTFGRDTMRGIHLVAGVGAVMGLDLVWLIADTLNAMMAIPNLVSLVVLSPVVVRLTREYFATQAVQVVQGAIE